MPHQVPVGAPAGTQFFGPGLSIRPLAQEGCFTSAATHASLEARMDGSAARPPFHLEDAIDK